MTHTNELTRRLAALGDSESLAVEGTRPREGVLRRSRLGGLVPERRGPVTPYVQALRLDDVLVLEACGSVQVGGTYPLTTDEHARMLALGWEVPDGGYPNYRQTVPVSASEEGAQLLVRALALLEGEA